MKKIHQNDADFGIPAWINAGQPDLSILAEEALEEEKLEETEVKTRKHTIIRKVLKDKTESWKSEISNFSL